MIKKFSILTPIIALFAIFAPYILSNNVYADGVKYSMEVSPAHDSSSLDPGAVYTKSFEVSNNGTDPMDFVIKITPYQVENHTYNVIDNIRNEYTQITDWITLSMDSGHLEPGEKIDVAFTINVPESTPAGAQYAMIVVEPLKGLEGGVVNAIQRVGYIVSSEISGETKIGGEILSKEMNSFLFEPPITAKYSVSNTGNVGNTASAVLRITNYFTGSEAYSNAKNPIINEILPGTERDMSISWDGSPYIGIFKANLTVNYLDEVATLSKTIFLCPIWFIIVVLLLLFIAISIIVIRIKKRSGSHKRASNF